MPDKKSIVLLIVEGQSDAIALLAPLNAVLAERRLNQRIGVDVYGTDCLLHEPRDKNVPSFSDPMEVIDRLKRAIRAYFKQPKNKLMPNDISAVVVVSDLDGCYVRPDHIFQNPIGTEGIRYNTSAHSISCDNVAYICDRNHIKVDALELILHEDVIQVPRATRKAVPLGAFYCNLNMEHAFYNELNELSQEDKLSRAQDFRDLYIHNPNGLMSFLKEISRIGSDYDTSHDARALIAKPCLRTSNLSYIIDWITKHLC